MARNEPAPEQSGHDPVWKSLFVILHKAGGSRPVGTNWFLHQMIVNRVKFGEAKYGTQLKPFNGRDPITDTYQELIDAMLYVLQVGLEHEEFEKQTEKWALDLINISLGMIDIERRLADGNVENDELAGD